MKQEQGTTGIVRVLVAGVEVYYSRLEGRLVFVGRPCGNNWRLACVLAQYLGARITAVGL